MKSKEQIPFWLITTGAIIILLLPRLVQDGMYTDGVLYAAVARNLSIGKGSLWFPYLDDCMYPFFHQQPPLTFGIQSLFYKAFGSSIYVERGYSFLMACITAGLIILLWKTITEHKEQVKSMAWLPVLFWVIMPVCSWSYVNNMEENTMGVFTLLSALFIYRGLRRGKWKKVVYIIIGAALTVPASLCKGFPGFFPVIIPALYFLIVRPVRYPEGRAVLFSLLAIIVPLLIYMVLSFDNYIYDSLHAYFYDRVLYSLKHIYTVKNRFSMLGRLFFIELIPPILITAGLLLFSRARPAWKGNDKEYGKKILFFLCIGISASFPLIISKEQRDFYLVPSFPFYAISFALVAAPVINRLTGKLSALLYKRILFAALVFIAAGLLYSFMKIGKIREDKEDLHDIYAFGKIIPKGSDVRVYPATWNDWSLHNYFVRHYNISLAQDTSSQYTYFMLEKSLHKSPPALYTKLVEHGEKYDLYKRQ